MCTHRVNSYVQYCISLSYLSQNGVSLHRAKAAVQRGKRPLESKHRDAHEGGMANAE